MSNTCKVHKNNVFSVLKLIRQYPRVVPKAHPIFAKYGNSLPALLLAHLLPVGQISKQKFRKRLTIDNVRTFDLINIDDNLFVGNRKQFVRTMVTLD